jgi:hypothetical protein
MNLLLITYWLIISGYRLFILFHFYLVNHNFIYKWKSIINLILTFIAYTYLFIIILWTIKFFSYFSHISFYTILSSFNKLSLISSTFFYFYYIPNVSFNKYTGIKPERHMHPTTNIADKSLFTTKVTI